MNELRTRWEQRAARAGDAPAGVLFQGLSENANAALHAWHAAVLEAHFLPRLRDGTRMLDLGCGYGRLGAIVRVRRPDIAVIGQDFVLTYCRAFARNVGPVVQADLEAPPFATDAFDGIVAVTSLMYAAAPRRAAVFARLARLLRPGGVMLLLDPGAEMLRLLGRLRPGTSPTGGEGFTRADYVDLARGAGLRVEARGGNPNLTCVLLVPRLARAGGGIGAGLLRRAGRADARAGGYARFALHRWLLVTRA